MTLRLVGSGWGTELTSLLNGLMARRGKAPGIATPANWVLWALVVGSWFVHLDIFSYHSTKAARHRSGSRKEKTTEGRMESSRTGEGWHSQRAQVITDGCWPQAHGTTRHVER